MRFFVAGSKGMLASDLIPVLEQRGEVIGYDRDMLDITDLTRVREMVNAANPDIVINCAAYTAVDMAESEKDIAFAVNGKGPENLAIICSEIKSRLVHISTDFVFDGAGNYPYKEEDIVNPLSVYGKSKLDGEKRLILQTDNCIIIRTSWLFGMKGHNFVKTIVRLAGEREEIGVVFDQVGTPTYTQDLAEGIARLIDSEAEGIFHFSNEGVCSWYDFAYEIIRKMKEKGEPLKLKRLKPILTANYPTPAVRPAYSVMDKSKYKIKTSSDIPHWRDGLSRYFEVEEKA